MERVRPFREGTRSNGRLFVMYENEKPVSEMTESELNNKVDFLFQNEMNVIQHAYVDICEDLVAGALLKQILYWFSPDKNGRSRVRIRKNGHYWLAKQREEWYREIRITPKQYDRAAKILETKGLIIKERFKFDGAPTVHIRLNHENLEHFINKWKQSKKIELIEQEQAEKEGGKSIFPKGKKPVKSTIPTNEENGNPLETMDFPQRSKTIFPKGQNGNSPKVKMEIDQRGKSLTEITTETLTESTYRDYNNNTEQIQQAKEEIAATKEKSVDVVVVNKLEIFNSFQIELDDQEIIYLLGLAASKGKQLTEVIQNTEVYFATTGKPINNLFGALKYGIENGWTKPKQTSPIVAKRKKLPQTIAREIEEPAFTDEELQGTYEDIQATMRFLRSTEKQVLHNKE